MCTLWHKTDWDTTDWRRARNLVKLAELFTVCVENCSSTRRGERWAWTFPVMWKSLTPTMDLRWSMQNGTDRKRVLKYISDCLVKRAWGMQKGSVASLWRSGTAGRIFQTFDEQFVAVDGIRPTVSDGLYSKCTPPPPPHLSVFYTTQQQQKRILNAPLPICLSSSVSTVWPNGEAHGEWNSTVQCHKAILLPRSRTVNRLSSRSHFTAHWHKIAD